MGATPSLFEGEGLPVESVTWYDCQEFIARLNEEVPDRPPFRLPTEAEWEYACKAGSKGEYCFSGDAAYTLGYYGWYNENNGESTAQVGLLEPNAWNLYDMHGNVWEWCEDVYDKGYYAESPKVDPTGPMAGGTMRVARGGGWRNDASNCRAVTRGAYSP